jgi:ADP-L-glycero-D-manno-heptose 6-epimerase
MLVVTGAAGFIGSALVGHLNQLGLAPVVAVDDFSRADKAPNLAGKPCQQVPRQDFAAWLAAHHAQVRGVFHIGARTDTTEFDYQVFQTLNLGYSQMVWRACAQYGLPLIYASSAATYGLGELGYRDDEALADQLKPLNPYGESKNDFDRWAWHQTERPPHWYGLKFFNVYGPNEYHKGRMASVIFHAFGQISRTGGLRLFRSHHPAYRDGEQLRDFVYVKDVLAVIEFLYGTRPASGIYNLGTGQARTFLDLAKNTFSAMHQPENISYVDTPADIRDKYQYFTQADMQKLRAAGYQRPFYTLEAGIADYVGHYLLPGQVIL